MKPEEQEAKSRVARGEYIRGLNSAIETLKADINRYAKAFYPAFHWMDHQVSTFWRCEKSPIGMCIFKLGGPDHNLPTYCVFCDQPAERK